MREIVFRGKRTDTGEWVCGDVLNGCVIRDTGLSVSTVNMSCECEVECRGFRVIPDTVGQYTGLVDKKGVKIFEGDIVLVGVDKKKYIVRFCQGEYLLDADGNNSPLQMRENGRLASKNTYYLKVIGTIHDKPKLREAN
jgi:uncharacterized phage protein (TIGR01671 family)